MLGAGFNTFPTDEELKQQGRLEDTRTVENTSDLGSSKVENCSSL